ncbi:hypothetical protein RIF25_00790 [Thermosynechococcaceae cyanobacterium BACA0444]|uniref:Uncharacterized protein n=1 Tax=Pseudocalidococcus azoricus BACA0444 TaxID=2918990 RepID=A0AAE4JVR2_9CYAN|nr:hypothetical protein [Pseudocalidococcus azoricus]MDS3859333.1 hypothetical protein [Pseudocalidococcus azoricus BACA0444]
MLHGLLWLPLLLVFFGLAGLGWHEWQKLQAYERWAKDFETAKYDVRAVLGLNQTQLTWGNPTRNGPVNLQTIDLSQIQIVQVWVDHQPITLTDPPAPAHQIELVLIPQDSSNNVGQPYAIPFTDITLAVNWAEHLQKRLWMGTDPGLGTPLSLNPS